MEAQEKLALLPTFALSAHTRDKNLPCTSTSVPPVFSCYYYVVGGDNAADLDNRLGSGFRIPSGSRISTKPPGIVNESSARDWKFGVGFF